LFDKPLVAQFDQLHGSSDGGAVLLEACDARLRLTERIAACFRDGRQPGKITHTLHDLIRQRVFAIACGYADCNDAARLADDPIHKLLLGRDALEGAALASQPTLSRFENAAGPKVLYRMGETLAEAVIKRQRRAHRKAKRITVELDPTDDPTHGAQQLALFNGHYDTWCYLPMAGFIRFDEEPEQYLFAYVLRPGKATAQLGAIGILKRVLLRLRAAFPRANLRVRLDGGFAGPEMFDFLEAEGVEYVVAMASNQVLDRFAEPLMKRARALSQKTGQTEHFYGECRYAAGTWHKRQRRVIIKAEVVRLEGREPRDNQRYVVTNLRAGPKHIYEKIYCQRGEIENRIKELHHGLEIDRTSCTRFWANQLRVLLTAAAYVLMQELRGAAAGTECARAQVSTLRERLLKLGVWVQRSVRRIVLHLPQHAPWRSEWCCIARALGAVPS
jgi:hypothetical protein